MFAHCRFQSSLQIPATLQHAMSVISPLAPACGGLRDSAREGNTFSSNTTRMLCDLTQKHPDVPRCSVDVFVCVIFICDDKLRCKRWWPSTSNSWMNWSKEERWTQLLVLRMGEDLIKKSGSYKSIRFYFYISDTWATTMSAFIVILQ